ncbi:MAG: efflux RND transporter periplasmic adaptor subunit [Candidatus Moraniibacteriota bacterium]|jgi:RND family efflux transporter MFP subunit
MKMKKTYIAVIALVVIGGGYYWYKKTNTASTAPIYKTAVAEKGMLTSSISGSGNVIVDQLATVDPTISGTVASLAVKIGDPVKKGQLLFTIINDQLGVSAAKASASYAQSKKSLDDQKYAKKQAEADYKTNPKKLLKDKVALADNSIDIAEQNLAVSAADYRNQLADAAKRKVTAPIDGTVNEVNIKNGDDLGKSSSSTKLSPIIIGDLGTLKASVSVNEVDIPNVAEGQKVMFKFSAIDGLELSGKVEKIDSLGTITQGVVTYNVTIGFDVTDPRIKPQMSVSANIITAVKQNALLVPGGAVKTQGGSSYVEVLNDGSKTPVQKNVEIGLSNNTDTEIISGISSGDKVVTQTITLTTKAASTTASGAGGRGGMGGFMGH